MPDTIAVIVLLTIACTFLVVWYRRVGRLKCSYTGTADSWAVWRHRLCHCSYPNEYATVGRRVEDTECLEIVDGAVEACKEPTLCTTGNQLFFQDGKSVAICRGVNVQPMRVDGASLGIAVDGGVVVPQLSCDQPGATRDARMWFKRPACIGTRFAEAPHARATALQLLV